MSPQKPQPPGGVALKLAGAALALVLGIVVLLIAINLLRGVLA